MQPQYTPALLHRFWSKVDRSGDCWIWTGRVNRGGYGCFDVGRGSELAHRVAFKIAVGPIPDDLCVLHHCDVRNCVYPDHLWLGTQRDNALDMVAKGRHGLHVYPDRAARGVRNGAHIYRERISVARQRFIAQHPDRISRGESHGTAKLTDDAVRAIRTAYESGIVLQRELADEHGVSVATISSIIRRKGWTHL
jgi:hypothetical protein